uniref:ZP domain-containing protein n=1 Tax=Parascaris equorum TaxID=6256 RepID=A0A914RJW8_PAREQ
METPKLDDKYQRHEPCGTELDNETEQRYHYQRENASHHPIPPSASNPLCLNKISITFTSSFPFNKKTTNIFRCEVMLSPKHQNH